MEKTLFDNIIEKNNESDLSDPENLYEYVKNVENRLTEMYINSVPAIYNKNKD
jgi:hypothetical protein